MSTIFSISEFALSLVDVMKTSVGFSNWESQSETPLRPHTITIISIFFFSSSIFINCDSTGGFVVC